MTNQVNFYFDHLLPPGPYQTVLELTGHTNESKNLLHTILLLVVARAVLSSLPDQETQLQFATQAASNNPDIVANFKSHQPEITTIIRQALDRALLALTAALQ